MEAAADRERADAAVQHGLATPEHQYGQYRRAIWGAVTCGGELWAERQEARRTAAQAVVAALH